ncbi:MAG: N-acetyl sugar amidotransferase [Dehalococcoidia bacterium]
MTTRLRRCSRCMIPETHETIVFDEDGVCNVCLAHDKKREKIDWAARKAQFEELIEGVRGKYAYDCIVPFSGGKDSTFTLYHLIREYGLKPLVVQFDHGFLRPKLVEQNVRTMKTLGADFLSFRPNWRVVQKLMLESLKRKGDFCWHCHTGIFSFQMQIAVKFQVPLLIWGEPSAEYTAYFDHDEMEEVDEKRFNRFVNLGITADDMVGMIEGVEGREMEPFRYPPLRELRRLGVRSVCLGSYIPWDVKRQSELIRRELGWEGNVVEGVPEEYYYEKVECFMQGVRDYLKYLKRGYGRTAHLTSLDIRNGRLDRPSAEQLVADNDGKRPASLDLFLEATRLDEETFHRIALTHTVAPWQPDVRSIPLGEPLPDQGKFIRAGNVRD